jgi:hypothetical protein
MVMARRLADMSQKQPGLTDLVLRAARDIGRVSTAFDAELLLSTLLGSVYSGASPDRGLAVQAFITALDEHLHTRRSANARVVRAVLAALSGAAPLRPPSTGGGPAWLAALGTVRVTGGYLYGDRYGDQTSYLATFVYDDEEVGGPEHAVALLVDHNVGLVTDIVIAAPADVVLDTLRHKVATDPEALAWLVEVDPATVRAAATAYLPLTDNAADLPSGESLRANRVIALARLALLPQPQAAAGPPDASEGRAALIEEFLDSPEAVMAGLDNVSGARRESLTYCLGLFLDFGAARGDALRWSPRAVETFLLDWVHQRAILDADDVAMVPAALGPWVFWAGRRMDLPSEALQRTFGQVSALRPEFERLCATGERQSPAARAMARLVADGVDLTDPDAVDAWLAAYNAAEC